MLSKEQRSKLIRLSRLLIDQKRAAIAVPAYAESTGYWFGGGNLVAGPDGALYLVGRYRNQGDSRTGLAAGERGLELAVFKSTNRGSSFEKMLSLSKQDLGIQNNPVLSIEGAALQWTENSVALYVSTEKDGVGYPSQFVDYLKPGTGVWSIDVLRSDSIESLSSVPITPLISSEKPESIHMKDPFLYRAEEGTMLFFCTHPFSWTSSNTGYTRLDEAKDGRIMCTSPVFDFFPRGAVWDVAMSRGTSVLRIPRVGDFADVDVQLLFYDGGECVRNHVQHSQSVNRPRGYSCEELGGVAFSVGEQWHRTERLSIYKPMFISPFGSGCSRYVDVLSRPEGMYATWQQAQEDGSQPLVLNFVSRSEIDSVLSE